ncbi:unnamed protein product, partial [Musa banksii]
MLPASSTASTCHLCILVYTTRSPSPPTLGVGHDRAHVHAHEKWYDANASLLHPKSTSATRNLIPDDTFTAAPSPSSSRYIFDLTASGRCSSTQSMNCKNCSRVATSIIIACTNSATSPNSIDALRRPEPFPMPL